MSKEQAAKYREMARRYREKAKANGGTGESAMADALERQAMREDDKAAMDINDVNVKPESVDYYVNPVDAQQNYDRIRSMQPKQQVAPSAPVVAQEEPATTWSRPPVAPSAPAQPNAPVPPPKHEPTAEELANMANSEQYGIGNNSYEGDLGLDLGVNDAQTYNQTGNDVIKAAPNSNPITNSVRNALIDSWGETQRDVDSDGSGFGGSFADKIDTAKKDVEILKQLYPEYYKMHMKDFVQ